MNQSLVKLVVLDMAGTTVQDNDEVLFCFSEACSQSGIQASAERLNALMGVSKLEVFKMLWREQLGPDVALEIIVQHADTSFQTFRNILENYYHTNAVVPMKAPLNCLPGGVRAVSKLP